MAYSFCPYCGAVIPDPAWRFCPSCGGRLPRTPGQDRAAAPAAGFRRGIAALLIAAGVFLVIVGTAALLQAFTHPLVQLPAPANASTQLLPAFTPEVPVTPGNVTMQSPPPPAMNNTGNRSGPEPPLDNPLTMPAPSSTPTRAAPEITIAWTLPYTYPAPAMGSSPEVPVINTTSLAARVHELVNKARQENGRSVLGTDAVLASIARGHSTDMASHGYFGHVNLDGLDPTARGAAAGYTCRKDYDTYYMYGIAENLFATYRYNSVLFVNGRATTFDWNNEESIAQTTVDAWMNSTDHRDNLLDKGMIREGIGVAIAKDDMVFITEDFC